MKNLSNEEKAKIFGNRKATVTSISIGTLLGDIGFGIWDGVANNFDCSLPVSLIGVTAALVTGYTLMMVNPYTEVVKEEKKEAPRVLKKEKK